MYIPILSNIQNMISNWLQDPPPGPSPANHGGEYMPHTYADICVTRAMLKSLKLPTELVLDILDRAQYWPIREFTTHVTRLLAAETNSRNNSNIAATLILDAGIFKGATVRALRSPNEALKVKDITFDVCSHDQGWSSHNKIGSYDTSSWLEVSIMRGIADQSLHVPMNPMKMPHLQSPQGFHERIQDRGWTLVERPESVGWDIQDGEGDFAWYLQGNRVANPKTHYRVVWGEEGMLDGNEGSGNGEGFLRGLRDGDRVLVWARAKYPGWSCRVESAKITVRYYY